MERVECVLERADEAISWGLDCGENDEGLWVRGIISGSPAASSPLEADARIWRPDGPGRHRLTVIASDGASAAADVVVQPR